jgi:hypothetical protein
MTLSDEARRWFFHMRGIETPCSSCTGLGTKWYSSGATWHGGMGTASCERDVCDVCWGSGDHNRPWTDLRKLRDEEKVRIAEAAGRLFAERCGLFMTILRPGIEELCQELDKFQRGRKVRARGFNTVAGCLAKLLREIVEASS